MLEARGVRVDLIDIERGGVPPDRIDGVDLLVVMGGPMNTDEEREYPFLRQEESLLRQALADDVPVLGICLGAQLLAKAADARVCRGPVEEFGWSQVQLTDAGRADPLFANVDPSMLVFQWHECTFDVPAGGELLATSSAVPSQAIRVGRRAYGLQFHVELDRRLLDLWMELAPEERSDLDSAAIREITATFDEHEAALTHQAAAVVQNFYRIASMD